MVSPEADSATVWEVDSSKWMCMVIDEALLWSWCAVHNGDGWWIDLLGPSRKSQVTSICCSIANVVVVEISLGVVNRIHSIVSSIFRSCVGAGEDEFLGSWIDPERTSHDVSESCAHREVHVSTLTDPVGVTDQLHLLSIDLQITISIIETQVSIGQDSFHE